MWRRATTQRSGAPPQTNFTLCFLNLILDQSPIALYHGRNILRPTFRHCGRLVLCLQLARPRKQRSDAEQACRDAARLDMALASIAYVRDGLSVTMTHGRVWSALSEPTKIHEAL